MDATWIITAFVVIDTLMERLGHRSDVRAKVPDSEILTIAVVAAKYFGNHHERAVQIMHGCGYLSGRISVSRFTCVAKRSGAASGASACWAVLYSLYLPHWIY